MTYGLAGDDLLGDGSIGRRGLLHGQGVGVPGILDGSGLLVGRLEPAEHVDVVGLKGGRKMVKMVKTGN